jgi:hypothetical protein
LIISGLAINADKAKSRHQTAGQSHNFTLSNKSYENVAKLKCLGKTETNQNEFVNAWGMLATIQFRILCLPLTSLKLKGRKMPNYKYNFTYCLVWVSRREERKTEGV